MRIGVDASVGTKSPTERLLIGRPWALLLFCAGVLSPAAQSQDTGLVTLPHHVVAALSSATRLPHTQQMEQDPLTVTVVLNLSDEAGRDALSKDLNDPLSPNYKTIISLSEFTAHFGPTRQAYDSVLAYLQQSGLTLTRGSDNRRTLTVSGTRAQSERAFNVVIDDYQMGDRIFHAIATDPAVPAALAPLIANVAGLSNMALWRPANAPSPEKPASTASAYNGYLTPAGSTNTGGLPPGLDGTGQTIGLIEFANFYVSDTEAWLAWAGLPSSQIQHLYTYSIDPASQCTPTNPGDCNGSTEVLLDIEAVMGIAPGADVIVFLASGSTGSDYASVVNTAAMDLINNHPGRSTLSMSWTGCEGFWAGVPSSDATGLESMLTDYAVHGLTLFASSGDNGSTCPFGGITTHGDTIGFPSDTPHAIAVGGTFLSVNADNSYQYENWWGINSPVGGAGGGFGVSGFFPEPAYQASLYPGATGRSVPDVTMESKPGIIVCQATTAEPSDCKAQLVGGTSLATPFWAAIWALAGEASVDAGGTTKYAGDGFLYNFPGAFHTPASMNGPDNDFQHLGLGSPDITAIVAVTNPPRADGFNPPSGTAAGGTTVTINGAGFIGIERVTFGGVAGTNVTILSDTKLTVVSPVASNALAIIEVVTRGGTAVAPGTFAYLPNITGINPNQGTSLGGTEVTVTGAFAPGFTFLFGTTPPTGVSCSSTKCTLVTPANAPGPVNVVAQAPSGVGNSISHNGFTYLGLAVTSFSPKVGPTAGGTLVTLDGTSMINGMTVTSAVPRQRMSLVPTMERSAPCSARRTPPDRSP